VLISVGAVELGMDELSVTVHPSSLCWHLLVADGFREA
jgi:hypothetical protein